jgi:hypothetical protein
MSTHRLAQAVARGAAAVALWGLLSAALTRALMRAIALTVNEDPEFTWGGTAIITFTYVASLLPGAVALAYSDGRWPWVLFGAGVALLAYGGVVIGVGETAGANGLTTWRWIGLLTLLAAMLVVYALQVMLVYRGARGRVRTVGPEQRAER